MLFSWLCNLKKIPKKIFFTSKYLRRCTQCASLGSCRQRIPPSPKSRRGWTSCRSWCCTASDRWRSPAGQTVPTCTWSRRTGSMCTESCRQRSQTCKQHSIVMLVYSGTSDKGPSKKGTTSHKGHFVNVPKVAIPIVIIPPRRGHILSTMDTMVGPKVSFIWTLHNVPKIAIPIILKPPRRGHPLYNGHYGWSQNVLYSEVPL